jgi:hypothetical protein
LFFYGQFNYIGLAIFARQWMRHRIGSANASTWVFVALCLNVFNIAYPLHALTETVSFSPLVVSLLLINDTIAAGQNPLSSTRFSLFANGCRMSIWPADDQLAVDLHPGWNPPVSRLSQNKCGRRSHGHGGVPRLLRGAVRSG